MSSAAPRPSSAVSASVSGWRCRYWTLTGCASSPPTTRGMPVCWSSWCQRAASGPTRTSPGGTGSAGETPPSASRAPSPAARGRQRRSSAPSSPVRCRYPSASIAAPSGAARSRFLCGVRRSRHPVARTDAPSGLSPRSFPRLPLLFRSAQVAQGYHCCLHAAVSAGAGRRRCSTQRELGSGIVRPGPRVAERGRSGDAGRAAITNLNVSTFCYVTLQCNASLRYYHYRHGDYYAAAAARRITPPWGPCRSPPPPLPPPTSRQRLRPPSLCLCSPPQAPYDQSACCRAAQS